MLNHSTIKLVCITLVASFFVVFNDMSAAIVFSKENSPYLIIDDFIVDVGDNIKVNRNLIIGCNEGVIFKEN